MKKTDDREVCYCCEREVPVTEGQWKDQPYEDYITQVFLCNGCLEEEARIEERFGCGFEFEE